MFKLRKREDYLNPRTTVMQVDLEGIICFSNITFDASFQEFNDGDNALPSGDDAEPDYFGS